jgi:flagellar motor switch protein FliG
MGGDSLTSMIYERSERIRRAAILVASLEETLADQMLAALPRLEAARIRAQVEELGEVDVEEQQDVLDEFRRAGRQNVLDEKLVEFTYSAPPLAAANLLNASPANQQATALAVESEQDRHAAADALLMAELLIEEHPQTVAAALSRLNVDQAAAVFAALPASLQAEVVDRLATLQAVDEDAVQELQSQLEQRVQKQRDRRQRAAAGAELARKILAKTPPAQQTALLARFSISGAAATGWAAPSATKDSVRPAQQAEELAIAVRRVREQDSSPAADAASAFEAANDEKPSAMDHSSEEPAEAMDDCSGELERLDDRQLLTALRQADEQTVQRALAASSERFIDRVARKLPRRQARRLKKAVRSIGPARLVDLRAAQNELLRLARNGLTQGLAVR